MLARSRDGRADHRVLVAGLLRQGFKDLLPYTAVVPATVVQVRHLEVSEMDAALERLFNSQEAYLLHICIHSDENVWPLVPPGACNADMLESME